jgi:AcrR family transcriptional regulator
MARRYHHRVPRRRDDVQYDVRRREILDVAVDLFRSRGYDAARLEDIAEQLGITKAAIYYYFPKKSDLLLAICNRALDESLARQERILGSDEPADVRLRRAIADHISGMATNVAVWDVFFRELKVIDDPLEPVMRARLREYGDRFEQLLADGVAAGALRPLDVRIAAKAILGMLNWSHRWIHTEDPDEVSRTIVDLLDHGLIATQSSDQVASGPPATRRGSPTAGR